MLVKKKIPNPKNHRLLFTFAFRFILLLILETLSIPKSEIEPVLKIFSIDTNVNFIP